ncbi:MULTISPECIES: hypothetical protein [Cyanophyceae]|uniref:hypothetical protein n=1 Tax=Cyanophyceae TaxID=3028117 RepID=UPI0016872A27|nr:hypothetical protein [Trichocoleus sp. FACHB-40]MBD2006323.1 hypothetical protein [Trichocoleus sp. FACHB-40]
MNQVNPDFAAYQLKEIIASVKRFSGVMPEALTPEAKRKALSEFRGWMEAQPVDVTRQMAITAFGELLDAIAQKERSVADQRILNYQIDCLQRRLQEIGKIAGGGL